MKGMRRLTHFALVILVLPCVVLLSGGTGRSSEFPPRAMLQMVARDAESAAPPVTATRRPPPPPGPGYCEASTAGSPSPPNAVLGLLAIGGVQAPAETLVTMTFDGKPGPGEYSLAAGGYRVLYAAGGQGHEPPCINEVGTEIGLLINGIQINTGVKVGDEAARPVFRYDVFIP